MFAFLYACIFISSLQTWSLRYLCPWLLKYFFLPLSRSFTLCIYFLFFQSSLSLFYRTRLWKEAEVGRDPSGSNQVKSLSQLQFSLKCTLSTKKTLWLKHFQNKLLGSFSHILSGLQSDCFSTNLKRTYNTYCGLLNLPTEEFTILTFQCAVIQWTLRPWGKQQPRREDCSQMKWGGRPGPNC